MAALGNPQLQLLPGARELLALHARELPQRDDLCGAFCGALALRAAGIDAHDGGPLDQDAVALAAGSVVSSVPNPGILPDGETGRRDYRLELPRIDDGHLSGTTAAGVVRALPRDWLEAIARHAAALSIVYLEPPKPPEQAGEVVVDIQPEAPPAEPPAPRLPDAHQPAQLGPGA